MRASQTAAGRKQLHGSGTRAWSLRDASLAGCGRCQQLRRISAVQYTTNILNQMLSENLPSAQHCLQRA